MANSPTQLQPGRFSRDVCTGLWQWCARTAVRNLLAAIALAVAITVVAGLPRTHLESAVVAPDPRPAALASDSEPGPQIVPRGSDLHQPRVQPRAVTALPTALSSSSRNGPRRGNLRAPDFGASAAAKQPSAAAPALPMGHAGPNGRGYNFVGAAGLDDLPFGGRTADTTSADDVAAALPGIPQESGPTTPVPMIPTPGSVEFLAPPVDTGEPATGPDTGAVIPDIPASPQPVNTMTAPAGVADPSRFVQPPAPGTSGFRATVESDAPGWIGPYMGRTSLQPSGSEQSPIANPSVDMPADFTAWWDPLVRQNAGLAPKSLSVEINTLVQTALIHSPQVQVLQADPEVQQRIVRQEEAAFDWRAYLETKYDDLNDPIGNTLTTGNADDRYSNYQFNADSGLKRRTSSGGEFDIGQKIGHQYNNSVFLLPNPQSTSRLELTFRQPLLSKAGTVYNESQIILARINSSITSDESLTDLQSHLYSVAEAYWKLYQARAELFQRQKSLASAHQTLITLEGRSAVDTTPRQTLRARAAVARAESRIQRAVTDIRNAESRLRLLVNDPSMLNCGPIELTPSEAPATVALPTGLRDSLQTALVNRPDISRAIREMRASSVRIGVSRSELLPKLDFLVSSYVAGLENQRQIPESIGNQFTDGRPGYTVGLEFEVPLGNRAAKARLEQRQWELQRAIASFRTTVETSLTEVEIASREVETAWRDMLGKYQAMIAAQNEVAYLQDRFEQLAQPEDSSILLLEDLLDGYERVADEESAFVQSQTAYALSIIQLRRSTGTLMRSRHDAPELEPDESQWMTSRADQTVLDRAPASIQTARVEHVALPENSGRPPASWSEPVRNQSLGVPARTASLSAPVPGHAGTTPHRAATVAPGHAFGLNGR